MGENYNALTAPQACANIAPAFFAAFPGQYCTVNTNFTPGIRENPVDARYAGLCTVTGTRTSTGSCGDAHPFVETREIAAYCPDGAGVTFGVCYCNAGFRWNGTQCVPGTGVVTDFVRGKPEACEKGPPPTKGDTCGNPINPLTGNKFQPVTDYQAAGVEALHFQRFYNSQPAVAGHEIESIGRFWRHTYQRSILATKTAEGTYIAGVFRPDGKVYWFEATTPAGPYVPAKAHILGALSRLSNGSWEYQSTEDDRKELYDADGKLSSIVGRSGLSTLLEYDASGRLVKVTDPFGRTLEFTEFDGANRITKMKDPGGAIFTYAYDTVGNLHTALRPSTTTPVEYLYQMGQDLPHHLTGVRDENGALHAIYDYHPAGHPFTGQAISTQHAGGAGKITIVYSTSQAQVTRFVRESPSPTLSQTNTYQLGEYEGLARNTSISAGTEPCPQCGNKAQDFDSNGYLRSAIDWNGYKSCYLRDGRGLETERSEGLAAATACPTSTPLPNGARRTVTQWHPTWRLPVQRTLFSPTGAQLRTEAYQYDSYGTLIGRTVTAPSTGQTRTWTWTPQYSALPPGSGQVLSQLTENGPRVDLGDISTSTYHAASATCSVSAAGASPIGCRAQIATVTNALGHQTTISEYNAHGQPLLIVDPNGLVTTLAYDSRQRLVSRNVGGEVTTYEYWPTGLLKKVISPDGSFLQYAYDAAHRLTEITDSVGDRISYVLDAMGNRTLENVQASAGTIVQSLAREYNALNRLVKVIGGTNPQTQVTQFAHDDNGNITSVDGPLAGVVDLTTNTYDELNRLIRVTSPVTIGGGAVNAVTEYTYDALDQITKVRDPRGLDTLYTVDGLGNRTTLVSPDTGTTTNTFDAAGNVVSQTDSKQQTTTYTYDALNRVSTISYHGGVLHTYQYDQGVFGKGRLTKIIEPNSTTDYAYDIKGRLTSEVRTINGVQYTTGYSYDAFGRLSGITYPGGRQVVYVLDSRGRIERIDTVKNGTTQTVVQGVMYRPFGAPYQMTYGNGQTFTRGFDLDGRITSYTLGSSSIAVSLDAANRIVKLATPGQSDRDYSYDELDRLLSFAQGTTTQSFAYDVVGNRTSKGIGSSLDTYAYGAASNRLTTITGSNSRSFTYDNNGSLTGDGINTVTYDARGRMTQATSAIGATSYHVNSVGQRIRKTNVQGDTVYHYDAQGRLIAEGTSGGSIHTEYIYLGDTPIAMLR